MALTIPTPNVRLSNDKGIIETHWWDFLSQMKDTVSSVSGQSFNNSAPFSGGYLYNTSYVVIQRGPGPWTAGAATYTVDRWGVTRFGTAGATVTRVATSGAGARYKMRIQRDNGNASSQLIAFYQALDSARSAELAGRQVVLSFYVTAGANYSGASLTSRITTGTGSDQASSGAPAATWSGAAVNDQTNVIGTTRTLFTHTHALDPGINQVGISFLFLPTGTAGAADYFEIDSVKLEVGETPTLWSARPDLVEIGDCMLFYEDMARDPLTGAPTLRVISTGFANTAGGAVGTNQFFACVVQYKTKRHSSPALTVGASNSWHVTAAGAGSYYDLLISTWDHRTLSDGLLQFVYTITGDGLHPPLANFQAVLLALDGISTTKFALDCELSP